MTPLALVKCLASQQAALNALTVSVMLLNKATGDMLQHVMRGEVDDIHEDAAKYEQGFKALGDCLERLEVASRPMREIGERDE